MSLIPCRECSHEVSPGASTCPRCGAPKPAVRAVYDLATKRCPFCGIRIEIADIPGERVRCSYCRATLAVPEEAQKVARELKARERIWARRAAVVVAIVIAVGAVAATIGMRRDSSARVATPATPPVRHSASTANSMCERFVLRRLDTPSTAKFAPAREAKATHEGGGTYVVRSYLDAQNLLGAMVRSRYVCMTTYQEDARTWRLDALDFL